MDRICAVLNIDFEAVDTRMKSLRTMYGRLLHLPTGYGWLTARQKDLLNLHSFLWCHVTSKQGISNLREKNQDTLEEVDNNKDRDKDQATPVITHPKKCRPLLFMEDEEIPSTSKGSGKQKNLQVVTLIRFFRPSEQQH